MTVIITCKKKPAEKKVPSWEGCMCDALLHMIGNGSSPAGIHVVFADAASEEALAAVAAGRPVVFASGSVSAYGTQGGRPQVSRGVHVGALGR